MRGHEQALLIDEGIEHWHSGRTLRSTSVIGVMAVELVAAVAEGDDAADPEEPVESSAGLRASVCSRL